MTGHHAVSDKPLPSSIPLPGNDQQPEPRITVSISIRTLAIIGGALLAYWILATFSGILMVFPIAILLATTVDKPAKWLGKHHIPRPLAVTIIFMGLLAALGMTISLLTPLIAHEVREIRENLPTYRSDIEDVLNRFNSSDDDARFSLASITGSIANHLDTLATRLTSVTIDAGKLALALFVTFVISIMMALEPTLGTRFLKRFLSPARSQRLEVITATIDHRIGYWVRGQVLIALTFGTLFGLGLGAIGIPYALTLAVTAAVLEVVPYLGGAVTVFLATLMGLTISVPHAIAVVVLYVVLVNVESHVLAPLLMGKSVGLPSVVVLASLFVGLETKGLPGVILAVPTVLVLITVIDAFWPNPEVDHGVQTPNRIERWISRHFHRGTT